MLRLAPSIGMTVPVRGSATSRAVLPYLQREEQIEILGAPPDGELLNHFSQTRERGYSISDGDVVAGSTSLAAPIFEMDGRPVGAVVLTAPSERIGPATHAKFGAMVLKTARALSRGAPAAVATEKAPLLKYQKETRRQGGRV
jgi:IclR family acetate operon transcriptional repressor